MKNKKILALTLATIIASGSINQMAIQVYAHDESLMAELSSTVESSHALPLKKI